MHKYEVIILSILAIAWTTPIILDLIKARKFYVAKKKEIKRVKRIKKIRKNKLKNEKK